MKTTQATNKQWQVHLQRSLVAHLALLCGLLVYVVLTDALSGLWAIFYQKPPAVIGVTFIDKVPSMPEKSHSGAKLPAQLMEMDKAVLPKKVKMPEMVKSATKTETQKTKMAQASKHVKSVQRQVSQVSKVTKTSMDRKVNLKQKATEKSSVPGTGKANLPGKKASKNTIKTKDQISNAQQIGAKKVVSSGKKVVEQADVQKSLDKVVAKSEKSQDMSDKKNKKQEKSAQVDAQNAIEKAQKAKENDQKSKQAQMEADQEKKRLAELELDRKRQHELGVIGQFSQMMVGHIQSYALFNEGMENRQVKLKVQLDLSGNVKSVLLVDSSGEASFDRLAINAVYKASPLPLPEDEAIAKKMTVINLTVKPDALH